MPPDTYDTVPQDACSKANRRLTTVKEEGGAVQQYDPTWYQDDSDVEGVQLPSPKRQRTGFACQACNMSFTEKRALARHKKTDHHRKQLGLPPDRKHACHLCGKCFTRGHDLKRHQTEQHKDAASSSGGMELSSGSSDTSTEHATSEEPPSFPRPARGLSGPASPTLAPLSEGLILSPEDATLLESAYPFVATGDDHRFDEDVIMSGSLPSEQPPSKERQRFLAVPDDEMFREYTEDTETSESPLRSDLDKKAKSPPSGPSSSGPSPSGMRSAGLSPSGVPSSGQPSSGLRTQVSLPDLQRPTHHPSRSVESSWHPMLCIICGDAFEDDSDELLRHLKRHLDRFKGQYRCKDCEIDFVHEEDLAKHVLSATTEGHCGFNFPHSCTGHHPPTPADNVEVFSDYDRARLCVRLQNWEQAQLQAYIAEVSDLTTSRSNKNFTRWSDVLRGSSRRNSFASFAISVNSYATAPCDVSAEGKTDIGGLQKRLQQMSLGKGAGARVKRLVLSGSREDLRSKTVDRSLQKAVKHNDVHKVEKLLDMGGDPAIVHGTEGPFIAKALWGYGQVSGLLAEHRLDEDIMGGCSVCHTATDAFDKGSSKIRALLRHGADANQSGGLRGFPLATAAWLGKVDIVKQLLDHGADVHNSGGKFGNALCAAASEAGHAGHADVIRLLVSRGARVDSHGPEGSALSLARGRREVLVRRLMRRNNNDEEAEDKDVEEPRGGSLSYCDEVIRILEGRDWSHVKRPSTAGAGGCREERGGGRGGGGNGGTKGSGGKGIKLNPTPSQSGMTFARYWTVDS
ncbi:uncharacterized protein RCC_08049 [Lecanosticta acicola]|uniref:Uncharacterized protein RCC_08049 n=1 Tax=Lecanosticta acicola TaxID=111012 RepID=A0AAI8Z3H0_9PEZI|nr:uncharacterized protein RCC_08049 [Lecanosticta acicola]